MLPLPMSSKIRFQLERFATDITRIWPLFTMNCIKMPSKVCSLAKSLVTMGTLVNPSKVICMCREVNTEAAFMLEFPLTVMTPEYSTRDATYSFCPMAHNELQ
jgi:hypothetical protein